MYTKKYIIGLRFSATFFLSAPLDGKSLNRQSVLVRVDRNQGLLCGNSSSFYWYIPYLGPAFISQRLQQ